jgi:uncharacterized protein YuzE
MLLTSTHDLEADALYVAFNDGAVARTVELDDGTLVDLDAKGAAVGLEVVHPNRVWPVDQFVERFRIPREEADALRAYARKFRVSEPSFGRLKKPSTGSGRVAKFRPVAV